MDKNLLWSPQPTNILQSIVIFSLTCNLLPLQLYCLFLSPFLWGSLNRVVRKVIGCRLQKLRNVHRIGVCTSDHKKLFVFSVMPQRPFLWVRWARTTLKTQDSLCLQVTDQWWNYSNNKQLVSSMAVMVKMACSHPLHHTVFLHVLLSLPLTFSFFPFQTFNWQNSLSGAIQTKSCFCKKQHDYMVWKHLMCYSAKHFDLL